MDPRSFRVIERKRHGHSLTSEEIDAVVDGAASGAWGDAELAAFLMAAAIRGLDAGETRHLTRAMLESGERWELAREIPTLGDKHSTGGVGDKVSLLLAPLLAACDRPVVMLTGRGLGHTGGTADKLESIPGLTLELDRRRCLEVLRASGMAIGIATGAVAPADRRLYALRDRTATIDSLPLIVGSIVSKKLASGAAAIVYDVKTGSGAFLPERAAAVELARLLVATSAALGLRARALVTDMSQPLGEWVGHAAEVRETLEFFDGGGGHDLRTVVYSLAEELSAMTGEPLARAALKEAVSSGRARERFERWAALQGADPAWLRQPVCELAPCEVVIEAADAGKLARVATRRLGELLASAGGGRLAPGGAIDFGVALRCRRKLGETVAAGDELARVYLRRRDEALIAELLSCFEVAAAGEAPPLIAERVE